MKTVELQKAESYKWWVLATISAVNLMTSLDASILYTSLPCLATVFRVDASVAGWLNIVYYIVSLSLMLPLSKVGDALGRKKVFVCGLAVYASGLTLAALSFTMTQLIIARALQGVGAAMAVALGTAITVVVFPSKERGKAVGILVGIGSAGLVVGPVIGGFLLDLLDWRAVFYVRVPVIIACLVAASIIISEQRREKKEAFVFDVAGAVALFVWLSALLLFLSLASRWGFSSIPSLLLATSAIVFFCLFIVVEIKSREPTIDLRLFKSRLVSAATVSAIVIAVGTSSTAFLFPFYLLKGLGVSGSAIGGYMAVLAAPSLLFSPLSGRLSDRIGSRGLGTIGVLVVCVSLFLLSRLGSHPNPAAIALAVALIGAGIGIFHPPNSSALIGAVSKDMLGVASAVAMMARNVGTSLGLAVSGAIFDICEIRHFAGLQQSGTPIGLAKKLASVGGFHDTLMILLPIVAIGVLTSSVRGTSSFSPGKG
jgi:EmrB/QacA subfamily drug resistance transporter